MTKASFFFLLHSVDTCEVHRLSHVELELKYVLVCMPHKKDHAELNIQHFQVLMTHCTEIPYWQVLQNTNE